MSAVTDKLVARVSGSAAPTQPQQQQSPVEIEFKPTLPGAPPRPFTPYGSTLSSGFASVTSSENPYEAGYEAGQQAYQNWMMSGGLNRLMGESCIFKGAIAYSAGGLMGLAMGAFLAPFDSMNGLKVAENATAKETAIATIHQTRSKAVSMGRTFASLGGIYGVTECVIEKYRAKSDVYNPVYAGCFTGGVLGRSAGPMGMAYGCGGFALWSVAIEKFMHSDMMAGSSFAGGGGDH